MLQKSQYYMDTVLILFLTLLILLTVLFIEMLELTAGISYDVMTAILNFNLTTVHKRNSRNIF